MLVSAKRRPHIVGHGLAKFGVFVVEFCTEDASAISVVNNKHLGIKYCHGPTYGHTLIGVQKNIAMGPYVLVYAYTTNDLW